jgi:hypothetical protein
LLQPTTTRMLEQTPSASGSETTPLLSGEPVATTHVARATGSSDPRSRRSDSLHHQGPLSPKSLPPQVPGEYWLVGSKLSGGIVDWFFHRLTGQRSAEVSLRLQNNGSVARDHLALERTFLAYMRTSLAIASAGVGKYGCRRIAS